MLLPHPFRPEPAVYTCSYKYAPLRGAKTSGIRTRRFAPAGPKDHPPLHDYLGADIRLIQDCLGHRNIPHTVRYTAINPALLENL